MKSISILFALNIFCANVNAQSMLPAMPEAVCPLLIGKKIPDINLKTPNAKSVNLLNRIGEKPTVLIFYRGGWCPYCNRHLAAIGEAEAEVLKLGYQIIAISPDHHSKLAATMDKQKLNYELLSDSAGVLAQAMGIAFQMPKNYTKTIAEASMMQNEGALPVPALFVLDKNGIIQFEYINPDFKTRISSKLLLAVLEGLK
jgi:peroxiredoxin